MSAKQAEQGTSCGELYAEASATGGARTPVAWRVVMSGFSVTKWLCGFRLGAVFLLPFLSSLAFAGQPNFKTLRGQEGFWRLGKSDQGVWWFVNPQGQPDFLNMVTTVQPTLHGRDSIGPNFVSRDFDEKNPAALENWAKATIERITQTGFKGIGAWSNPIL